MIDTSRPVSQFLDGLAARQPTPGGGSVAALVGALAAALGEMTLNYSLGKKDLAPFAQEFQQALARMGVARTALSRLVVEDQQAYEALATARRAAPETPGRGEKVALALSQATDVPASIAREGLEILELCDKLVGLVNFHMLSDLAICADLAMAAIRCATFNVRINLPGFENTQERLKYETTVETVLKRAVTLVQNTAPRIWKRHQQGV
jgi:methenyltetrahydrofolate cyclohydrolase